MSNIINIKRSTSIRINFNEKEMITIEGLMERLHITSIHDLIRYLITDRVQAIEAMEIRYNKTKKVPAKKKADKVLDTINELKAMTPEDLTEHLHIIGYFEPYGPVSGFEHISMEHKVVRDPVTKLLEYHQTTRDSNTREFVSNRVVFNWEELVEDLKKEKKL